MFGFNGKLGERSVVMDDVKMIFLIEDILVYVVSMLIVFLMVGFISLVCIINSNY